MRRTKLLSSVLSISAARLVGQALSLLVGILISANFGATVTTDSYYTALILPPTLANLVINILANLFAPIYLKHIQEHPDEQSDILGSMNFITFVGLGLGMVICLTFVPIFTVGRNLPDAGSIQTAVVFGVTLTLLCPLVGFSRLLGVYCETNQRYTIPAIAALISPLTIISVIVLTFDTFGIYSLLIGSLLAHTAEFTLLLIYTKRQLKIRFSPQFRIHPVVKEMLRLSALPAVSYIALFFVPTVDRSMISGLSDGQLTAYNYGERIVVAFETIVLGGPVLVMYYHWANRAAVEGIQSAVTTADQVFSLMNYIFIPVCIGGALLSFPLLSIIFERGTFTRDQVSVSAAVFAVLLLSQLFNYTIVLSIRLLLLDKAIKFQAVLSIIMAVMNLLFNLLLAPRFGLTGIVFSTFLTRALVALLSLVFVNRRFTLFPTRRLLRRSAYSALAAVVMMVVVGGMQMLLDESLNRSHGLLPQIAAMLITILAGGVVYTGLTILTRHPDAGAFLNMLLQTPLKPIVQRLKWS